MRQHAGGPAARLGHAAAATGAADLPLRRGRLRRAERRAGAGRADQPAMALGSQDGVLAARLGGRSRRCWPGASCRAGAAGARHAGSTPGRRCCCWPMRARASCWRSCSAVRRAEPGTAEVTMKFLLLLLVLGVAAGAADRARPRPRPARRRPAAQARRCRGEPMPMLACAHCGVHLPQSEALTDAAADRIAARRTGWPGRAGRHEPAAPGHRLRRMNVTGRRSPPR